MNKKLLIFGICMILLIPFISAMDWDNVKSYDENKKEIIITNALGLGENLAKVTLIDNSYFCLKNCEANIKLELYKNNNKLMDDLKFYKIINENLYEINFDNKYEILLRTGETKIYKERIETICDRAKGIDSDYCETKIVPYYETIYEYKNINELSDNFKIGTYYIKIKGQKEVNETIEWIPKFMGSNIDEWAIWSPSLSNGLIAYWDLNGTYLDQKGIHNGSSFTSAIPSWGSSKCLINNCSYLNITSGAPTNDGAMGIELNKTVVFGDSFSVMVWFNMTNLTIYEDGHYAPIITSPNQYGWEFLIYNAVGEKGDLHLLYGRNGYREGETVDDIDTNINVANGNFHQVILTRNAVDPLNNYTNIWVDGIKVLQTKIDWTFNNYTGYNFTLGRRNLVGASEFCFNGTIDDTGIWNRTLSDAEISDLYNLGLGITYEPLAPAPSHTTPILNTTLRTNTTNENLTCWNQTTSGQGYPAKSIFNYYLNDYTLKILDLSMEGNSTNSYTRDYARGNHGSINRGNWSKYGGYDGFGAYTFNKSNYISLTNPINFRENTQFSVSWWSRNTPSPSKDGFASITGTKDNQQNSFLLIDNASTTNRFRMVFEFNGTGATGQSAIINFPAGDKVNLNNFHHFVLTENGTNMSLYIDGVFINSTSHGSDNMTFQVIGTGYIDTYRFNGTIDDFTIWNRTLSKEQVILINNSKSNFISSSETELDDIWKCGVIPVSENGLGNWLNSSALTILSDINPPVINNVTRYPSSTSIPFGTQVNCSSNVEVSTANANMYMLWYKNGYPYYYRNDTLLHLSMDSNLNDDSGNSNNGTNPLIIIDTNGGHDGYGAYKFSKKDSFITLTKKINFRDNQPWSINWWSKNGLMNGVNDLIISIIGNKDNENSTYIRIDNASTLNVYEINIEFNSTGTNYGLNFPSTINLNQYHNFAITSNGSNLTLYIDGVNINTTNYNSDNMTFGVIGSGYTATSRFNGTIDEFSIFNRTLSTEEIVALNNTGTMVGDYINPVINATTYFKAINMTQRHYHLGDNITCGVILNDTINKLVYMNSSNGFINSSMYNFTLTPALMVNASNSINGSMKYTGDSTTTIIFNWFKNGIIWITKTFLGVTAGQWVSDVLNETEFTVGDNITLQIVNNMTNETQNISAYIHLSSNMSSIRWLTTDGFDNSTLNRKLIIDYVNISINGLNGLNITINVTMPNTTKAIEDSNMINTSLYNYKFDNNFNLTISGKWNISITTQYGNEVKIFNSSFMVRDAINLTNGSYYTKNVTEGSMQVLSSNATIENMQGVHEIKGYVVYDNITYGSNLTIYGNYYWFNATIPTPIDRPESFFLWNYTIEMNNGNIYYNQSGLYNQSFTNFGIDNCTSGTLLAINFTLKDEETKITIPSDTINSSIEVDFIIRSRYNPNANWTYNHLFTNITNAKICVTPESLNQTGIMVVEGVTSYESIGYVQEYYYFDYLNISNNTIPHNINLYDLATAKSTSFLVTYYDCDYTKVQGAIINVLRRYIADGNYINVEMGKTSVDGQTILHLNTEDVLYKYWITKQGEFLWENTESPALCLASPCQLNIYQKCSGTNPIEPYNYDNIIYSLTSNKTSRIITLIYNTKDGSSPTITMNVTRFTNYLNNSVCSETTSATGGTLTCTIPLSLANATYYIDVKKDGKNLIWGFFDFSPDVSTYFGKSGLILSSLAILSLVLMGATTSGVAVIIFAILGLIFSSMLYFFEMQYATLIWIILAGVIIIYKIARRTSTR